MKARSQKLQGSVFLGMIQGLMKGSIPPILTKTCESFARTAACVWGSQVAVEDLEPSTHVMVTQSLLLPSNPPREIFRASIASRLGFETCIQGREPIAQHNSNQPASPAKIRYAFSISCSPIPRTRQGLCWFPRVGMFNPHFSRLAKGCIA